MERAAPNNVFSTIKSERRAKKRKMRRITKHLRSIWKNAEEIMMSAPCSEKEPEINIPKVDWSKVNKRFLDNIPKPQHYPVHGCSNDPSFYQERLERKSYGTETRPSMFEMGYPFGSAWGIKTDCGVIPVGDLLVHGHRWVPGEGWLLHAQFPKEEENVKKDTKGNDRLVYNLKKKFKGKKR